MKPLLELRGIITVLNTPYTAGDQIDLKGFRQNVRNALAAGVAGFLVPAMASEAGKLSEAERLALVQTAIDEAANAVPVIGGASAPTGPERIHMAKKLIDLGCAGVLASLTYTNDTQYRRDVAELAELDPGFLMVQDWDFNGYGAPVPLIADLFEQIDAFRCLKVEVVPAGAKYTEVLRATGGRLHVSGGWAVQQMIEALDRGVHAFMPTGMHPIYTEIVRRYASGDREAAKALHEAILPVLAFSNQHLDISIHFFKRLLWRQGVFQTPRSRQPILPFDKFHEQIADELIERVRQIEAALT